MAECYHNPCDTATLNQTVPFANLDFMVKTTQVRTGGHGFEPPPFECDLLKYFDSFAA
jgi:hypothetical protein